MLLPILIIFLITVFYYLLKRKYEYWERRKIPGPKPSLLVGNMGRVITFKDSLGVTYTKIYNDHPDKPMVGIYRLTSPVLLVRDPELIKEILVKSFNYFQDNDMQIDKKHDAIIGRNPFVLKGEEWRRTRAQLTPGFTSGKMKWIFPLLEEVCAELVKFIDTHPDMTNGNGYEAKELCMKFTLDNVGTCAFGLKGKCFEEENSHFRELAGEFFAPDSWGAFSFFLLMMYPPITKILPIRMVTKKVEKKLINMVSQTLKYREDNNIVRNDFLHILSQLKNTCKDFEFTDVDATAHAAGFFSDGFETSSIVMSFILFELAANPDAQEKLRQEVKTSFEENNGKITYDLLQSLRYLDAVIQEGLRMHPPLAFLQKVCTKSTNLKGVPIKEGTSIVLSVFGLHRDPKYYDEPDFFKPERFLEENRDKLTKYTFLAFGEGPRVCLGQRFGVLQIKAGIAYIIRNFEMGVNKKTQLPIKYVTTSAMTTPVGGLWIDFKKIV